MKLYGDGIEVIVTLRRIARWLIWVAISVPICGIILFANVSNTVTGAFLNYSFIGGVFLGVSSLMLFTVAAREKSDPSRNAMTTSQWARNVALVAFSVSLALLTLIALLAIVGAGDPGIDDLPFFLLILLGSIISPFVYFPILVVIDKRATAQWARRLFYLLGIASVAASLYFYR